MKIKVKKDPTKSLYDQSRNTVGKIYRDLQMNANPGLIEVGDMSNDMMPGLVEDINDAIEEGTKDFEGRPFYVMIHEKKDLQMPSALLRKIYKQLWRPYPEDDTTVFWHDPRAFKTCFCWSLPHWSEMNNILANSNLFDHNMVEELKAWKRNDLTHFGFIKDETGNWTANPNFKDKPIEQYAKKVV
jgi:hypothetical protein